MSHNLLRPIRRLVAATERIASGDLDQHIPVRSGDELGVLTRSFNHMVRNLRDIQGELIRSEKLISMGRLSAGVAHEIRNPLNTMKGAIVHLQRRRPHDPLIREYTQLVLEEVDRLNHFVTEFLYFARQSAPTLVPTDLNDLIQHTLVLFEERLSETQTSIVKTLDPFLPLLPLDPHQMKQVIVNLIMNALDAMPEGGILEVATRVETHNSVPLFLKTAVFEIRDHGVGIQEQDLNNVLDPFFSTKENGTGLGLPISQGIVENHGGTLAIRSRKGEGTTVTIVMNINRPHSSRELVDEKKNSDC
jgi:signal transduction histidine kinase